MRKVFVSCKIPFKHVFLKKKTAIVQKYNTSDDSLPKFSIDLKKKSAH